VLANGDEHVRLQALLPLERRSAPAPLPVRSVAPSQHATGDDPFA
jgi:hypothetical protein